MSARFSAVLILLLVALGFTPPAAAELVTELVTVVQPGPTVRYLALHTTGAKPAAGVILFAGGNGVINLGADGSINALKLNFLVRSRVKFAEQGLFVAVVDAPGKLPLDGAIRTSHAYASAMSHVILDVRKRISGAPVWLVGTSSGTLSAAGVAGYSAAAAANLKRPNGIVLTSTQSKPVAGLCGKTVFDAALAAINVPTYIVSHKSDGCACSPFSGVRKVLDKLTGTRVKDSIPFSGGDPPISKDPCEATTPHGFLGIEDAVVAAIADWIKTH